MKITAFNGSPRGASSNTQVMVRPFEVKARHQRWRGDIEPD